MNAAPLIPMSPRPESSSIGSPAQMRIPLTSPGKIKPEIEEKGKEIPLTPLPPISTGKLPSIASSAKSPLPPLSSATLAPLPPLSSTLPPLSKLNLPPLSKTTLPPSSAVTKPVVFEAPKTTLPPISSVSLPPISPAPVAKTALPPLSKLNLPPLSKPALAETGQTALPSIPSTLPPVSEPPKVSLPPVSESPKVILPPIIKSPSKVSLPPLSEATKLSLPPLSEATKLSLPPMIKSPSKISLPPLPSAATGKPTAPPPLSEVGVREAPLAVEVKATRTEQVEKIRVEAKKAEERQLPKLGGIEPGTLQPLKSLKPLPPVSESKSLPPPLSEIKTLKPLPSLKSPAPEMKEMKHLVAPPSAPISALEVAREGVKTAKGAEAEAAFQGNLATIASPANLPSKKAKDTTPKIRIPKIAGLAVKSSPKRAVKSGKGKGEKKGEIELPTDSTVIPSIPITSPAAMKIPKAASSSGDNDLLKIINSIDVSKLRADRVKDKDAGYNVNDLKTLAGALNLPKSGNKKDLVDRIKALILKVKPNAFDQ